MKFFTRFVVTALAVLGAFAQNTNMTIITPSNVIVCKPTLITWTGGNKPYYLTVNPIGQTVSLLDFPKQDGTSLTWLVNLPFNSGCSFSLRDNDGAIAQSGSFIIGNSSDTSCLTQPLSVSGSTPTSSGGSSSVPSSTSNSFKSNSTGDALPNSQFHIGTVAIVGAVTFALVG